MPDSTPGSRTSSYLPHERLDVYQVGLDLAETAYRLARAIPRGHGNLASQIQRSSTACVLNIVEAAARRGNKDKANRFTIARAEAQECLAACRLAARLSDLDETQVEKLAKLVDRVSAMLWRLLQRYSGA